jgi:erythrocyte band 7 integral membrane protein
MNDVNGKAPANSSAPMVKVQPPRREDLQPSYAQKIQPDTDDSSHSWYGGMINTLGNVIGACGAIPCCICCPNPFRPVDQGNVGLVTRFGRFSRAVDPGLVKVNPLSERLIQVDVKIQFIGMLRHSAPPGLR